MSIEDLSINLATVRQQWDMAQAVDACLRHGITAIAPWRDQVEKITLAEAARIVHSNGLRVTGLCRGGMFPAADRAGLAAAIDDNKRAIDEAAALGSPCLVLVVGGLPQFSRPGSTPSNDIAAARAQVSDAIAALLDHANAASVDLAIEPLHPMYAADRACVNTLGQALDICDALDPDGAKKLGVAIDVYHVWWDPELLAQIKRAGAKNRIHAFHICDWLVPTRDLLLDRGMMGDGVIEIPKLRAAVEAEGFTGPCEVEVLSEAWWAKPIDAVLSTIIERYRTVC